MGKYFKWGAVVVSIIIVIVGIAIFIGFLLIPKNEAKEVKQDTSTYAEVKSTKQDKDEPIIWTIGGQDYDLSNRDRVLRLIHEMTHTRVEADSVGRLVLITPERVDTLISVISKTDWSDKDYLLENLNKWKNKDFSDSVELHNYIWKLEGGNIGKATGLRKNPIE